MLDSHRWVLSGCDQADSIVVNPHKWLFTPIDCSVLYCRRPEVLKRAFALTPAYLTTAEGESVRNLMDYGASLGRRFRGLKLWFVLRAFGLEGARRRIDAHLAMQCNLVTKVVPHRQLRDAAELVARQVLRNSQRAVRSAKETILEVIGKPLDDQLRIEGWNSYTCFDREEAAALLQLFYDKADPGRAGANATPLRKAGSGTADPRS